MQGLGQRLGITAELFDLQAALGIRDKNNEVPAYIAALGLALGHRRPQRLPFDFLNPKRRRARRNAQKIRRIAPPRAAGAVVAMAVFPWPPMTSGRNPPGSNPSSEAWPPSRKLGKKSRGAQQARAGD